MDRILDSGPVGASDWECLVAGSAAGVDEFAARVTATSLCTRLWFIERSLRFGVEELSAGRPTCISEKVASS